ncbi:hypothetical protein [Streptomyces sp. NPDC057877]|uniref:hypothetical protein n=1 Tax=Streptomyces sp. NPDC057877 TaxID=3346269 RepID=UPI0036913EA3
MQENPASTPKIRLVASDEEQQHVRLTPGTRYEVAVTTIVDSQLEDISEESLGSAARPPRLCGSRSTCVAIVEIE